MGLYRFLLAVAVVIGHTDLAPQSFQLGVVAVVSFLILSGYVMSLLVARHYASPDRLLLFYLDRAGRIFPQYLFYLAVTVLLVGAGRIGFAFAQSCSPSQLVLNTVALPLSWAGPLGMSCQYMPQAWSIGLELSFYLAVPFLLRSALLTRVLAVVSLIVFGAALLGVLNTETYAYRTLPGTLFIFLVGMSFARPALLGRWFPWLIWSAAALCWAIAPGGSVADHAIGHDVMLGLMLGIPLVAVVRQWSSGALDTLLGDLSYGVFLNHLLVFNVLEQVAGLRITGWPSLTMLLLISTVLSWLTYQLIEAPVLAWRRALRRRAVSDPSPAASAIS